MLLFVLNVEIAVLLLLPYELALWLLSLCFVPNTINIVYAVLKNSVFCDTMTCGPLEANPYSAARHLLQTAFSLGLYFDLEG
jgi:hypothetical protein